MGQFILILYANNVCSNSDIWRSIPAFLLKYIVSPIFRLFFLTTKQGARTSIVASLATNLPKNIIYLQPYKFFSWNRKDSLGLYKFPHPIFEMLGVFAGFVAVEPRLPEDVDLVCSSMWNVCDEVVKPYTNLK